MASTREIRTIRIEDWLGNVYKPEGVGSGGSGGQTIGGDDITPGTEGSNTTDGTILGDPTANNSTAIVVSASDTSDKNVATVTMDGVSFGKYAVNLRMKSSRANGSDTAILAINIYYVDNTEVNPSVKLSSTSIKEKHFKSANKYTDIGFVTDFVGVYSTSVSMKIEVILKAGSGVTITFDNVTISKAFVSVTGTPTTTL